MSNCRTEKGGKNKNKKKVNPSLQKKNCMQKDNLIESPLPHTHTEHINQRLFIFPNLKQQNV